MTDSRLRGLHRLSIDERLSLLESQGCLTAADAETLRCGRHLVSVSAADRMVENLIATFALPLAVAPNFVVDGRDHVVPMVVEEPSVVAALSAAARLARRGGGFGTSQPELRLTGQVHLAGIADIDAAERRIQDASQRLVAEADAIHPRLVARGGGVRALATRRVALDDGTAGFQPTNLEITTIDTGNPATNVIPAKATLAFNIRFNDRWTAESLKAEIEARVARGAAATHLRPGKTAALKAEVEWPTPVSPVFLTQDETLVTTVSKAVEAVTGRTPVLSTSGGTSDARFIKDYCPVVEFGLVGKTMHMVDECVAVDDLETLTAVYERIIADWFAGAG